MVNVIQAEGLAKRYLLKHNRERSYSTLRDAIAQKASAIIGSFSGRPGNYSSFRVGTESEEFWALRNISFEIKEGERIGVIGRNGAGKSTLLKILSRITEPSAGKVTISGRVASLLEVGTGFHPELSGRENIFLNGAMLGMSKSEITQKFDEIIAFAEVEKFLDTPVKRYSSGMYVRLAFAVAAHLEPEIMIVDEVLAVGDQRFQNKCLGKMNDIGTSGRTIVFVSHNMNAVTTLCDKAIWIDQGVIKTFGPVRQVISQYLDQNLLDVTVWTPTEDHKSEIAFHSVSLSSTINDGGGDGFPADAPIYVEFDYSVKVSNTEGRLALAIKNQEGTIVFTSASTDKSGLLNQPMELGRRKIRCIIPEQLLAPGRYSISVAHTTRSDLSILEDVLTFRIGKLASLSSRDGRFGIVTPLLSWEISG